MFKNVSQSREKLFDLAVNRALSYARKMGKLVHQNSLQKEDLETWYLQTRFVYRISLDEVISCLNSLPDMPDMPDLTDVPDLTNLTRSYYWQGGVEGAWFEGKAPQP